MTTYTDIHLLPSVASRVHLLYTKRKNTFVEVFQRYHAVLQFCNFVNFDRRVGSVLKLSQGIKNIIFNRVVSRVQ